MRKKLYYKISFFAILMSFLLLIMPMVIFAQDVSNTQSEISIEKSNELAPPSILPGSPFYIIKLTFEKLVDWFTFDKEKKSARYLEKAKTRLAEATALAKTGDVKNLTSTIKRYKDRIQKATIITSKIKKDTDKMIDVFTQIEDSTKNNQKLLEVVLAKIPDKSKSAIKQAIDISKNTQNRVASLKKKILQIVQENKEKVRQGIKKGLQRATDVAETEISKWGFK